jgi:hypothetical protein
MSEAFGVKEGENPLFIAQKMLAAKDKVILKVYNAFL